MVQDSKIDSKWGDNEFLSYFECYGGYGINTLIKGKSIYSNDCSLETRSLEIRINIEERILRVGSLPNYESVVEADNPNKINPFTPYKFFLYGLQSKAKMTITRLEKVSEFNSLMWDNLLLDVFEIIITNLVKTHV